MLRVITLIAITTALLLLPAGQAMAAPGSEGTVQIAKKCKRGKKAKIGGKTKCLIAGQYCSRKKRKQYVKYGFSCSKKDKKGRYHLVKKKKKKKGKR